MPSSSERETESKGIEGLRVLVVDDQPEVLEMTLRVFKRRKADARGITDPRQVLPELAKAEYDILMLDLTMPQMSGAEVFAKVRTEHPALPVLFYSGYPETSVQDLGPTTRTGYLQKPFTISDLVEAVQRTYALR